jgi:hypothetical protein
LSRLFVYAMKVLYHCEAFVLEAVQGQEDARAEAYTNPIKCPPITGPRYVPLHRRWYAYHSKGMDIPSDH